MLIAPINSPSLIIGTHSSVRTPLRWAALCKGWSRGKSSSVSTSAICMAAFALTMSVFLGRTPDRASREDVRGYLLHLASSGVGAGTVNGTGSALRFFFDVTLDRADIVRHLPIARGPCKAPIVLSPEEVARMLEAAPGLKYKAALSVAAYEAGLRVSEVVALKVNDIDSARMMIRIEQSKRRKDRYAMLSPRLLKKAASYASAVSKKRQFRPTGFQMCSSAICSLGRQRCTSAF